MEEKRTAGEEFVRWIKPGGAALVILFTIVCMTMLFTSGKDPVAGYAAQWDTAYYQEHPDELLRELEEKLFPALSGIERAALTSGGKIAVTLTGADYAVARSAILYYYDLSLFEFITPDDERNR